MIKIRVYNYLGVLVTCAAVHDESEIKEVLMQLVYEVGDMIKISDE